MITLPVSSFVDRPLPYLLCYLLVIVLLCLWPFNFLQMNQVAWEPEGGLKFTPPATAFTLAPPAKLTHMRAWTIFLDIKALPYSNKPGRILGYSLDERHFNLILDQISDDIVLRLHTAPNQRAREVRVEKLFEPNLERRLRFALVYDGSDLSVYVDGERRTRERIGTVDSSAWGDNRYPLILGSHADGTFGWRGVYYGLAVFARAVDPGALRNGEHLFREVDPALSYTFNEHSGFTAIDHGAGNPAPLSWPVRFSPYERTILQSPRDYWPELRHPYLGDIIANIILYLPFGYLVSVLVRYRMPASFSIALPPVAALCMSLTIEILQAYLPTRSSSMVDVIMNGLGACFGVYVYRRRWLERILAVLSPSFRQPVQRTHPPRELFRDDTA